VTARALIAAALDAETLASLAAALAPGLLVALAALLVLALGVRLGRAVPPRSLRRLEESVRRLIAGDFGGGAELDPSDPAAGTASLLDELAERLRDRSRRLEQRAVMIGQAFENVADRGMLVVDRELRVVAAGESLSRMTGLPVEEIESSPCSGLFEERGWAPFVARLMEQREREEGVRALLQLRRAGDRAPLTVRALGFEAPGPRGGIAIHLEAAEPLEKFEGAGALGFERLSALFEGLADGLVVVRDGVVRSANPAARRWLGEDVLGRPLGDMVAAEDLLLLVDRVGRAERGERVPGFQARIEPGRAGLRSSSLEILPVPLEFQDERAAVLSLRDAGAANRERRLARLRQMRLLAIVNAAADGLFVLDRPESPGGEWRLSLINQRARQLLQLPESVSTGAREDALRGSIAHRFREPVALLSFFDRSKEEGRQEIVEAFDLDGPGARSFELVSRPVVGTQGEVCSRVVVVRDITRHRDLERSLRKEAETLRRSHESLQQAYDEMSRLGETMQSKADELDAVSRELRDVDGSRVELIASVAHELQTPLSALRGYSQMVHDGRLGAVNDEQRTALDKVLRNVDRMSQLIENLLAMARAEQSAELHAEPVDVNAVFGEVVERHRAAAAGRGIEVDVEVPQGTFRLFAEREGLVQVLDNLVSNAIKYNRESGRVRLSARPAKERFAELRVEDTGRGVPEDERERIFERFFRGRGATGTAGSGIGLATVRAIVERHDGRTDCADGESGGARFTILWPLAA
jgi:signal transduction histidine kinase